MVAAVNNYLGSRLLDFQNQIICFLFGGKQFGIATGWADFSWLI